MDGKVVKAFEAQVNKEFYSWYFYLAMVDTLENQGLKGFGHWMREQAAEENMHAMKLFNYVQDRGASIELKAIDAPPSKYGSVKEIFETVLKHEQGVSDSINQLYQAAHDAGDHASMTFLQWFLNEQVEEEKSVGDLLARINLVGDDKGGLLMLDKEMEGRTADSGA